MTILEEPRYCLICGGEIDWMSPPGGGWWAHRLHPADGHTAEVDLSTSPVIEVISAEALAAIEEKHEATTNGLCSFCDIPFPCNAWTMLEQFHRLRIANAELVKKHNLMLEESITLGRQYNKASALAELWWEQQKTYEAEDTGIHDHEPAHRIASASVRACTRELCEALGLPLPE